MRIVNFGATELDGLNINLAPPRFVKTGALSVVGLKQRYTDATYAQIPMQWRAFQPHMRHIDERTGSDSFGVICNRHEAGDWDYLTGVEVKRWSTLPGNLSGIQLAAQIYAVFRHEGDVSRIRNSCEAIFGTWLPNASHRQLNSPWFERYGERFDAQSGQGDIEIWIPICKQS
jgi:AraC family transcriptional regulator